MRRRACRRLGEQVRARNVPEISIQASRVFGRPWLPRRSFSARSPRQNGTDVSKGSSSAARSRARRVGEPQTDGCPLNGSLTIGHEMTNPHGMVHRMIARNVPPARAKTARACQNDAYAKNMLARCCSISHDPARFGTFWHESVRSRTIWRVLERPAGRSMAQSLRWSL